MSTELPPTPPATLTEGTVVKDDDPASLEAAKVRVLGSAEALYTQGLVTMMTVYVDSSKATGVPA